MEDPIDIDKVNHGLYVKAPRLAFQKVDALEHTAQDILEKMAYEAHGGKYIVGLWEAPMPGAVTPIRYSDAEKWDVRPMEVEYKRPSGKVKMINGQPISVKSSYRPKNKNFQFFGYKSEPPSNPLFKEDEPVGPVAKAIKSAGVLIAIGKEHGEDVQPVRDLMKNVWNVDIEPLEEYIQPDLVQSSVKDLIKLQRNTTHTMAGFPGSSPGVSVHLTSYRSETIEPSVYVDWHRVALSMRWVGEWNSRYNRPMADLFVKTGKKQLFTPVLSEMPRDIKVKFINFKSPPKSDRSYQEIAKVSETTLAHYTGMISQASVATRLRSKGLIVNETSVEEFDALFVRKVLSEDKVKVTRLPTSILEVRQEHIELYKDPKVPRSLISKRSKLEFEHHFSGRGALKTLLEAYLTQISGTRKYTDFRTLITQNVSYDKYGKRSIDDAKRAILRSLPDGFGDMLYTLLRLGTANDSESNEKFADLLKAICPKTTMYEFNTKSSLVIQALKSTDDLSYFLKALGGAYRSMSDKMQSERGITFRVFPGAGPHDIILDGLERYAAKKIRFWINHYESRVLLYVDKLKSKRKAPERSKWKLNVVSYSAIRQAYKLAKIRVGKGYWIYLETRASDWIEWGIKCIESYLRKRLTKKQQKKAKYDEELSRFRIGGVVYDPKVSDKDINEMKRMPNCQALFAYFDRVAKPKHSFLSIWHEIHRRLLMTSGSIGVTFRARICTEHKPSEVDVTKPDFQDILKVLAGNQGVPISALVVPKTNLGTGDTVVDKIDDSSYIFQESKNENVVVKNQFDAFLDEYDVSSSNESDDMQDSEDGNTGLEKSHAELLSVEPETSSERLVRERTMNSSTSGLADDMFDSFGDMEEADIEYVAPESNIVNLRETINAEYGSNFTSKEIAETMEISTYDVENYNLNWNVGLVAEIYGKLISAITKDYDVDFEELANEGRDIA